MKIYEGKIKTTFFWLVPLLIGVSKNNIDNKANVYALHITPFLEIGFNWKGTRNGYESFKVDKTTISPLYVNTNECVPSSYYDLKFKVGEKWYKGYYEHLWQGSFRAYACWTRHYKYQKQFFRSDVDKWYYLEPVSIK